MPPKVPATHDATRCTADNAKSIRYEFALFEWLPTELPKWDWNKLPGTGYSTEEHMHFSALLEAFLVHTRVLLDFFGAKRDHDDFLAIDFVDTWDPSILSQCVYLNGDQRGKLNKMVAHPSSRRQFDKATTNWDYDAIRNELTPVINAFRTQVSMTANASWFQES
jgi:hypothetical protein